VRLPLKSLAPAVATVVLAAPAPALAAQSYAVTLQPSTGVTCERTLLDVTMAQQLVATAVYTESPCGFAAQMSKAKAPSRS
jgi:hypothetical protein